MYVPENDLDLQADRKVQSSEGRAMAEELKMLFFEARCQLTTEGSLPINQAAGKLLQV